MNPPLRTDDDVAALQEAVRDGTIDCVATDHAPHHYDEKEREFADAPNGIVGLETALGVLGTWLVEPACSRTRSSSSAWRAHRRASSACPAARCGAAPWPT
jgi:dihydroorotase